MKLRALNEAGVTEFTRFIKQLKLGENRSIPVRLLEDEQYSNAVEIDVALDDRLFATRYEMAEYLNRILPKDRHQYLMENKGMWSWLGLYWFDQLCPEKADHTRKVSDRPNYVYVNAWNRRYRHAVYTAWQAYALAGENCRSILSVPMKQRGELAEAILSRIKFLGWPGVMALQNELYLSLIHI